MDQSRAGARHGAPTPIRAALQSIPGFIVDFNPPLPFLWLGLCRRNYDTLSGDETVGKNLLRRHQGVWHQGGITVQRARVPRLPICEDFVQSAIPRLEEIGGRRIIP